jgi:hypothetical protein
VNQDIPGTQNSLIDSVARAWDAVVQQIDDFLGGSPGPVPSVRRPSAMSDGELRSALRGAAASLIRAVGPAREAPHATAAGDARWRFNLPAGPETQVPAMFTAASDAFRLAVTGLDEQASPAGVAAVGRLAETLARTRWLLEPDGASERRERGYALAAASIARLRSASGRAAETGGADAAGGGRLAREIADRAATMAARLTELREADGLRAVRLPKRRKLLQAYLPAGAELLALLTAADPGPAATPSALFYAEAGTGDPLRGFQRLHLSRAYWTAQAIVLYAEMGRAAAPVLGRGDWEQAIAAAEPRYRPLCQEAARRYAERLRRGLHPGL